MLYRKNDKGYTLVELLIAIVIGFVLISAATATYIAQNRSYIAQESVSEINTQSKIAHDLIANAIKGAGYGVPADMGQDTINGFTTIIIPVEGGVDISSPADAITIVGGFRRVGELWPAGGGTIACPGGVVPMDANTIRIVYTGNAALDTVDRRFISIDGIDFLEVSSCTLDGNGDCDANNDISLDRPLLQDFPLLDTGGSTACDVGRPVYLIEDVTFCVDANSTLRRIRRNADITNCAGIAGSDNDVIAENIEDLQFAYAVDANNDGQIDDLNSNNMLDGGDFINGSAVINDADIRAIRINILARAARPDVNYAGLGLVNPLTIENRTHAATSDDFRRRWWQTLITMRNQGD